MATFNSWKPVVVLTVLSVSVAGFAGAPIPQVESSPRRAVGPTAFGAKFYAGMVEVVDKESIHDLMIPVWILGGLMHGVTTAYLSG